MRNSTSLTLEEGVKLCQRFHISVDSLLDTRTENVVFQYFRFRDEASFKHYLTTIQANLERIAASPDGKLMFADDDLPILHHFRFLEHTAFKLYYWLISSNATIVSKPRFSPTLVGKELLELASKVYATYAKIPSIEIGTLDGANTTLRQILYCWEAGFFESKDDALQVCEQFLEILQGIEEECAVGRRLQLYLSEIQIDNNCIWTQVHEKQEVYIRHQTFNMVHTESPAFCQDTQDFLQTLIQKSTLLSGTAEKQRSQFFLHLRKRVGELMGKIG